MSLVGFNIDCVNVNANKMMTDARNFDIAFTTDTSEQRMLFGFGSNNASTLVVTNSNVDVKGVLAASKLQEGGVDLSSLYVGKVGDTINGKLIVKEELTVSKTAAICGLRVVRSM